MRVDQIVAGSCFNQSLVLFPALRPVFYFCRLAEELHTVGEFARVRVFEGSYFEQEFWRIPLR